MRKLIAGMRMSIDGKIEGPEGYADWVDSWSDGYDIMPQVDACLLGRNMYAGYEEYWTGIQKRPDTPHELTGALPTREEVAYARFTARTPHYVFSNTLTAARWPQTSFVRGLDDVAALKARPGKDIYVVGGGRTVVSLLEGGLLDELRLQVHPLIAGEGKPLFATTAGRRGLKLRKVERLEGGRVSLIYDRLTDAGVAPVSPPWARPPVGEDEEPMRRREMR